MRKSITLGEVVDAGTKTLREGTYHCFPASVVAFHADTETVDAQIMVNDVRFDLATGERFSEPWPVIYGVKIAWPKFGKFLIQGPMAPGDGLILTAFDLDPTPYFASGNRSDPAHTRRHAGAYWKATPCDLTDQGISSDAAAAGSALIIGVDGAAQQIRIDENFIQLGSTGGDYLALASKVNDAIKAMGTWAASGTGTGYTPPSPPQPTPDVGSTLIKAQ